MSNFQTIKSLDQSFVVVDKTRYKKGMSNSEQVKMADTLTKEIEELQRKIRFIKHVHRGDILVVGRLKTDIIKELQSGDENFLELSLTIDQCTELENELAKKKQEVEYLKSSSAESMYEEDLKKFESMLSEVSALLMSIC